MNATNNHTSVISVAKLTFSYRKEIYQVSTLRDFFIQSLKSPWQKFYRHSSEYKVLDNINFELKKGERLALMGANGAGKTTLCQCLAGILQVNGGEIQRPPSTRAIFAGHHLIDPYLTGHENAQLLGNMLYPELTLRKLESIIEEAGEFSQLGSALNNTISTYSHGMRARLFLSVATALPCQFLILDEAQANLDQAFEKRYRKRLEKLIEGSLATIIVNHNQSFLREYCNRALQLKEGKIAYFGSDFERVF